MKKENVKTRDNIEKLGQVIEEKKKIPKKVKEQISAEIFRNIIFGAIILLYLGALNIGMKNIPTENYIMDLKVFGISLLALTIIVFEIAYKKDKGELWMHGVEIMVTSIFTIYLIYLYSIYYNTYGTVLFTASILYLIYYGIKILIERKQTIKNYNKSLTDIGEIVKKG